MPPEIQQPDADPPVLMPHGHARIDEMCQTSDASKVCTNIEGQWWISVSSPKCRRVRREVRQEIRDCVTSTMGPALDAPSFEDKEGAAAANIVPHDRPSSPPGNGSENGGGNGDGGGGKRKKSSGEHAATLESGETMVMPTDDVKKAVELLEEDTGIVVETPTLFPTSKNQREYRQRLFPPLLKTLYEMQQKPELHAIKDVKEFYAFQAEDDAYKAGEITVANLAVMYGFTGEDGKIDVTKLFCSTKGEFRRKKSIEFAPGNGEFSRDLRETRKEHYISARMRYLIKGQAGNGRVTNGKYDWAEEEAKREAEKLPKHLDPYITSVDLIDKFVEKGQQRGINALKADICFTPEKFFEATGIEPNSADFIYMNLAMDRLSDLSAALQNMKYLAKLDKTTQFLFGFYAPFSPNTDSFSKNANIPEFAAFDPTLRDIRQRWIGLDRSQTICNIMADLNVMRFKTTRVAEHEYEVYSVHCIVEPAAVLREDQKYAFLQTYDFKDEELNTLRDDVFSGKIEDDELVGFPERQNVVLIAGEITKPIDGSEFAKYTKKIKDRDSEKEVPPLDKHDGDPDSDK